MSNRYLIHLPSGKHFVAQTRKQEKLFEKLSQSDQYMWSDQQVDVSAAEAKRILEAERVALIKEREELEQERALFENERAKPVVSGEQMQDVEMTVNEDGITYRKGLSFDVKPREHNIEQPRKTRAKRKAK